MKSLKESNNANPCNYVSNLLGEIDEISDQTQKIIDDHISGCHECNRFYLRVKAFQSSLTKKVEFRNKEAVLYRVKSEINKVKEKNRIPIFDYLRILARPSIALILILFAIATFVFIYRVDDQPIIYPPKLVQALDEIKNICRGETLKKEEEEIIKEIYFNVDLDYKR